MIAVAAIAIMLRTPGRGVFVGAPAGDPALVEDETMTAQTLMWFVVVVSVVPCVFTCVGSMTQAPRAASK